MKPILEVKHLNVTLKQGDRLIPAVEDVSFSLQKGEALGIIGESGSGKSLTCSAILGLLRKDKWNVDGEVLLDGTALPFNDNEKMSAFRGSRISLIMQNPISAFNPVITIEKHFRESINKGREKKLTKEETRERAVEMLERMRIRDPQAVLKSYSFQLSGGMLQRIMIALALTAEPDVLVADEPTTALDLTVQHEIIKIIQDLIHHYGTSVLLVSHDLGVISHLANNISVMYGGVFVESGSVDEIIEHPTHPYTQGLFESRPEFSKERLHILQGQPPALGQRGKGCCFCNRCKFAEESCEIAAPNGFYPNDGHFVRCDIVKKGVCHVLT